jgi:hypothetical protein
MDQVLLETIAKNFRKEKDFRNLSLVVPTPWQENSPSFIKSLLRVDNEYPTITLMFMDKKIREAKFRNGGKRYRRDRLGSVKTKRVLDFTKTMKGS